MLGYLFSILDWQTVRDLKPDILGIIFAGSLIFFLALSLMSFRWRMMLARASTAIPRYLDLVRLYVVAQYFNLLMPGSIGGDAVRATTAARKYDLTLRRSIGIVICERFFGLSAIFILVVSGFLFYPAYIREIRLNEYLVLVAVLGAVIALFIAVRLLLRVTKSSFPVAIGLLLLSATAHLADVVITLFLATYFEVDINFTQLLVVIPIVYFVTILPISLGGLGVREGAMVALLAYFNVGQSIATIIAFSLYLTKFLVGLAGGLLYLRGEKPAPY